MYYFQGFQSFLFSIEDTGESLPRGNRQRRADEGISLGDVLTVKAPN